MFQTNNIANFLNDSGLSYIQHPRSCHWGEHLQHLWYDSNHRVWRRQPLSDEPSRFLFGPNATVNVGGMVAFTSADYLRLADGNTLQCDPQCKC